MTEKPAQSREWAGAFGKAYTDRNPHTPEAMDALHRANFDLTRSELNRDFLGGLDRSLRILEVGANVGIQLTMLRQLGFERLSGVEVQPYAIQEGRTCSPDVVYIQGSAIALPFKDASFDLVFTSGVLIHISPQDIDRVLMEVHRCTRRYIWGWEYFAEEYTVVPYRGREDLLWKGDFAGMYRDRFPELALLKQRHVPYLQGGNVDTMFLLEKSQESLL